jgi:hypothetical protein
MGRRSGHRELDKQIIRYSRHRADLCTPHKANVSLCKSFWDWSEGYLNRRGWTGIVAEVTFPRSPSCTDKILSVRRQVRTFGAQDISALLWKDHSSARPAWSTREQPLTAIKRISLFSTQTIVPINIRDWPKPAHLAMHDTNEGIGGKVFVCR